jgi:hypothetical protein
MGRGSRVVGYRRLTGGVCSAVNRVTVERGGLRTFVVLRQYPGGLGLRGTLEEEIANLGVVAGSGLPVPGVLAADVAGASTGGAPSLLMTAGRRRYLAALCSPEWAEQLRSLSESIAGVALDPWWDLYALLHYDDSGPKWIRGQVAGRRPVDVPGMTSRVEVAIETALRRLG